MAPQTLLALRSWLIAIPKSLDLQLNVPVDTLRQLRHALLCLMLPNHKMPPDSWALAVTLDQVFHDAIISLCFPTSKSKRLVYK